MDKKKKWLVRLNQSLEGITNMEYISGYQELRALIRILERNFGLLDKCETSCSGLTFAKCHAIVEIGRSKTISLIELAEKLNLDNSTMSRTVNNLVNKNLAERELNTKDRRYIKIKLTENGLKIFENIEVSMAIYFQKVTQSIPKDKVKQVIESLKLLINAINESNCC
jgi:DNA-binding MarR family transcriptional regulator